MTKEEFDKIMTETFEDRVINIPSEAILTNPE